MTKRARTIRRAHARGWTEEDEEVEEEEEDNEEDEEDDEDENEVHKEDRLR